MTSESTSQLTGISAVVTGSSSGIGRAIALELARGGANVLIHAGRHLDRAQQVAEEVGQLGVTTSAIACDISTAEGREELLARSLAWAPRLDVWINNAGADVLTGDAANWSFEQKLDRLWQVDVKAAILLSRKVGDGMIAQDESSFVPSILNVGWDQAETGMAGDPGEMFGPIKSAVMAFTRSLAKTLAPRVRVNCVAPGWIRTSWGEQASEYWQQRAVAESLLNRWGTPQDVAQTVSFLVSPAASYITGQVVAVNGGFAHGQRDD